MQTSVNSNIKTRILVRLLNGETLSKVFNATDKLNDVLLWIQLHTVIKQFDLMTNFPKKVFTEEDYRQSLDELHLVPSAVVIATEPDKWNDLKEYRGITTEDENRQVEEKRRKEEIDKQVKEMEEERVALERVRCQIDDDKAARRQRWPQYVYFFHLLLLGFLVVNLINIIICSLYANQPPGNQLVQNQPNGLLPRARSDRKKFE